MENNQDEQKGPEELSYEHKAIEMAREQWEKEKKKALNERRTFYGLQIIPTASFYDESHGHRPGEKTGGDSASIFILRFPWWPAALCCSLSP